MDPLDLTRVNPEVHGTALNMNQQAALEMARKFETEAAKLPILSRPRMALERAASALRDFIACTL